MAGSKQNNWRLEAEKLWDCNGSYRKWCGKRDKTEKHTEMCGDVGNALNNVYESPSGVPCKNVPLCDMVSLVCLVMLLPYSVYIHLPFLITKHTLYNLNFVYIVVRCCFPNQIQYSFVFWTTEIQYDPFFFTDEIQYSWKIDIEPVTMKKLSTFVTMIVRLVFCHDLCTIKLCFWQRKLLYDEKGSWSF